MSPEVSGVSVRPHTVVDVIVHQERLEYARMQSRDHSRRSRQRRKEQEVKLRAEIEELSSFRTLVEVGGSPHPMIPPLLLPCTYHFLTFHRTAQDGSQLISIHTPDMKATFLYANPMFAKALHYCPPVCDSSLGPLHKA
jgi:hypothetical protein